jgi:branched-subunit amino acid transport protein
MNDPVYLGLVIVSLTLVSAVNRSFFFLSRRPLALPASLERGLRYAPLGALIAVIAPEVALVDGSLATTPFNARICAALAAACYALWRRRDILGTIVAGMCVYLTLHLGLNW